MKAKHKKSQHRLTWVFVSLIAIVVVVLATSVARYHAWPKTMRTAQIDGVFLAHPTELTDFKLTDNHGKPFTKQSLQGHWTLMFLGFTNCAMVCPTSMSELSKMYQVLQKKLPAKQLPMVLLVSVDPERDTVERMNDYVTAFNPNFMGAVGDVTELESLKKQLHVVSGKMKTGSGNQYTINHSAEVMVFNPEGKLQAYLSYPHKADQMVTDYMTILKTS